jgi:hypothetical protein
MILKGDQYPERLTFSSSRVEKEDNYEKTNNNVTQGLRVGRYV